MKPNKNKKKKAIIIILICAGIAILSTVLVFSSGILDLRSYKLLTGSMEPAYSAGSLIYVKKLGANDSLNIHDVITFQINDRGNVATHRIVEIVPDEDNPAIVRYRTKGDANPMADSKLVSRDEIIGKVIFSIPGISR